MKFYLDFLVMITVGDSGLEAISYTTTLTADTPREFANLVRRLQFLYSYNKIFIFEFSNG